MKLKRKSLSIAAKHRKLQTRKRVAASTSLLAFVLTGSYSAPVTLSKPYHPVIQTYVATPTFHPIVKLLTLTVSPIDQSRALDCMTTAIYYEAAKEPADGQRAVAQVILNRVAHPSFPNTVCGVIYQGSEVPFKCQFTFACDGSLARRPEPVYWDRARLIAREMLSGERFIPVGLATHYHTYYVHPDWDKTMINNLTIGAHQFYTWPGIAGQTASFNVAYRGNEPENKPHQTFDFVTNPVLTKSGQESIPEPTTQAKPVAPPPEEDSQILPQWRNSGKWIKEPN